jgi:sugar-specific transcriptional regulator TrmB
VKGASNKMDTGTQLFIKLIDEKMQTLRSELDQLQSEKEKLLGTGSQHNGHYVNGTSSGAVQHAEQGNQSRREQLIEFLRVYGPATPAEILKETKIPRGTMSPTLSLNPEDFKKVGRQWTLVKH